MYEKGSADLQYRSALHLRREARMADMTNNEIIEKLSDLEKRVQELEKRLPKLDTKEPSKGSLFITPGKPREWPE